jgi:hypothetical protein
MHSTWSVPFMCLQSPTTLDAGLASQPQDGGSSFLQNVVNFYCAAWCRIPENCSTFQLLTDCILIMALTCEQVEKLEMCPTSLTGSFNSSSQ